MRPIPTLVIVASILTASSAQAGGVSVTGRVVMPDVCSPGVSPAVVVLEPVKGQRERPAPAVPADVALVNQRGLQFVPRVQAIVLGQAIRFTNDDSETHNVHIVSPGNPFNQSMAPGQPREFTPVKPGVVRLACDIHAHMRGYVVVSASPWVQVCSAEGQFHLKGVPAGNYRLTVWHEMGDPLKKDVTVSADNDLDLATLILEGPKFVPGVPGTAAPVRPWADVVDRIGVLLGSSLESSTKAGGYNKARKLAEDAYFVEFEGSEMETAVRLHLGFAREAALVRKFRALVPAVREVAEGRKGVTHLGDASRDLLLALVDASRDLNSKGVTDSAHVLGDASGKVSTEAEPALAIDRVAQFTALRAGFDRVRGLADKGDAEEAAAQLSVVYFEKFEPIERFIRTRRPLDVRVLEERFTAIRGEVGAGLLKGQALGARLDGLFAEASAAFDRVQAQTAGSFGTAFGASFVTALREGAEVILLLTMLVALAVKTGQAGAVRAIAWGVALAVVASAGTAYGLNLMVASAQGRTREIVEGGVMLAAAGVLFYVSYWLISQSESKRWMTFLKRQVNTSRGGAALFVTAFLAVYREGAETALMYQAMIGSQAGSRAGLTGLAAGLGAGLAVLGVVALLIRATSVRIPLRAFFQVTGTLLFAMAVVFAGNGVFELQSSEILKITPLTWLGSGLPILGFHPNLQAVSVQGLLVSGALLALLVISIGDQPETPAPRLKSTARLGA